MTYTNFHLQQTNHVVHENFNRNKTDIEWNKVAFYAFMGNFGKVLFIFLTKNSSIITYDREKEK